MGNSSTDINIRGKKKTVKYVKVFDKEVYVLGVLPRMAHIKNEFYIDSIENPKMFVEEIKKNILKADIFTFWQQLPQTTPRFSYRMEWENVAAITITTYDKWFNEETHRMVRKAIRKSNREGLYVKKMEFNDDFIKQIQSVFNETPIRQGKMFWHYGKNFETIKNEMLLDLNNSEFYGAYINDLLIGFMKLIYTDKIASFSQILSKIEYQEKRPTNMLINHAVKVCEEKGIKYLVYGNYSYGNKGDDSLSEFKANNGFRKIDLPRYYIPLNKKGEMLLLLNLHKNINELLPKIIIRNMIYLRDKILKMLLGFKKEIFN